MTQVFFEDAFASGEARGADGVGHTGRHLLGPANGRKLYLKNSHENSVSYAFAPNKKRKRAYHQNGRLSHWVLLRVML